MPRSLLDAYFANHPYMACPARILCPILPHISFCKDLRVGTQQKQIFGPTEPYIVLCDDTSDQREYYLIAALGVTSIRDLRQHITTHLIGLASPRPQIILGPRQLCSQLEALVTRFRERSACQARTPTTLKGCRPEKLRTSCNLRRVSGFQRVELESGRVMIDVFCALSS